MKQLLYHIIVCCTAVLFFTACEKDDGISGGNSGRGDGNSILLDLSSETLPVSRSAAAGAEIAVNHIDVLIFDDDGAQEWHERISVGDETGTGKITLTAKRSDFTANADYWVYLIANSTAETAEFEVEGFDLNALKAMTQRDANIHITGLPNSEFAPKTFLMDGVAYEQGQEEPETASPVVLNDGEKSNDTELKVTLRRAAAKILVRIKKGADVTFGNVTEISTAGYYLRNIPYTTSVIAGMDGEAELEDHSDKTANEYFNWGEEEITVTAYTYSHSWANQSTWEKEVRLVVNIPLRYNKDEEGTGLRTNNYYQIPVSKEKILKRNTCYAVTVTVNYPGATDPTEPVELKDLTYSVEPWDEEQIEVGGESDLPRYLTLNEYEMEMHNMEEDNTTLQFASSSDITTVTIDRVYYINKFGQEQDLKKQYPNNPDSDEWGEERTTSSGWPWGDPTTEWVNICEIRITPDAGLNGKIDVYGDVPENNAVRYIEFTLTNEDNISRKVTVAQYPLTYITNVEGYYSYRDDFVTKAGDGTSGVTTWELLAGKMLVKGQSYNTRQVTEDWRCGCSWNSENNNWSYGKASTGFFSSKIVNSRNSETGLSDIEYARWSERGNDRQGYTYNTSTSSVGLTNHRMYHVTITATSNEYTLGKPRITDGKTDPGADNAVLVSPSFMLASQLGAVFSFDDDNDVVLNAVAEHCERYVEVAQDGTVYNDWRLPTKAEIEIIYKYQNDSDVMDEVLAGEEYWSASGLVTNPDPSSSSGWAIRCIRDAYGDKTPNN